MLVCAIAAMLAIPTFCNAQGGTPVVEHQSVAIKDVCAWPNLTKLPDGSIAAMIFNQPAHGTMVGDVDCWASEDEGLTWERRGTGAPHPEPKSNRMNVAAGLASDGDFVLVSSGYRHVGSELSFPERLMPASTYRSSDGGHTWTDCGELPTAPDGQHMIPFGDILPGADGRLRVTCYTAHEVWATYMLGSDDDGRTWAGPVKMGEGLNECAPLHLGDGRWIAAIRTHPRSDVRLLSSTDDGASWEDRGPLTRPREHPAHLARLSDGRILLTCGNRNPESPGIDARFSPDEGETWTEPVQLLALPMVDLGYPSSVQLGDGRVLTAYYARQGPGYDAYHMGVIIWRLPPATD